MNVQINMQDPETPPFNCQGRNHVAGNCAEPSAGSLRGFGLSVLADLGFVYFKYLVYLRHVSFKIMSVPCILNRESQDLCLLLRCKVM